MSSSVDVRVLLALSGISFLKSTEKDTVCQSVASFEELCALSITDLSLLVKRVLNKVAWNPNQLCRWVQKQTALLERYNIKFCRPIDAEYPPLLRELYEPPFMLFYRGDITGTHKKSVSIVGTRKATANGLKTAFETAQTLCENGIPVVSGLALGIDTASHRGALASGMRGATVAVLACGVDGLYPLTNSRVGGAIIENGGCILSEYPPDVPPAKWRFPERNRIIAGLSPVTVVIESPPSSGALITADFALEAGRDVVFHEVSLLYPKRPTRGQQTNARRTAEQYIKDGAPLVQSARQIIELVENSHIDL